jgi:D-alanyl-D-alanine carboxypeptidase
MKGRMVLGGVLLLWLSLAHADAQFQEFLGQTLEQARARATLPAVAALVQIDGHIEAESATGVRAVAKPRQVTLADRWHIGSDTKAMTATLIARLVERGFLSFDDTLPKIFPGVAPYMNAAYRDVTVAQVLSHTAGLPKLTSAAELANLHVVFSTQQGLRAQRAAVAAYYLRQPPASKAGEFAYSNLGYIIAGAIAESYSEKTWEDMLRVEVWKPLGITSAGFGPPGKVRRSEQPLGHDLVNGKLIALAPTAAESDIPPAVGPAGSVNISLHDWLQFAQDQLDGLHGHGKLLEPATYLRLHTPVSKNYAMGWGVLTKDGAISLLSHTGSNGYWVANIRIMPKHDTIFLLVTNAGGERAEQAIRDIGTALTVRLEPLD